MLLSAITFMACDKESDDNTPKSIIVPDQQQLSQTVYADNNAGKSGVTFTTTGAWSSEIKESASAKSTRAAADWISISPSSGDKAGDYTINISLETNYTGEKRTATISLKSSGEMVNIVVTQEAVTAAGDKPKPDPEPSGSGILNNETTGQSFKLTKVKHSIFNPTRVNIEFFGEKLYDDKEKEIWFNVEFANPLENGKLKPGTYNINYSGFSPHPNLKQGECYFMKSTLYYLETGTIKVELDKDIYKFTFDGMTIAQEYKIIGSFTGVPEYLNKEVKVESITLNENSKTLEMLENFTLTATILPENATDKRYSWSSSNPAVATVSEEGLVKSVSAGTTTITATSTEGAKTATCAVTVNPAVAVTGITVEPSAVTVLEGEYLEFYMEQKVTVLPKNATNKKVTWTSSDEKIAVYTGKGVEAKAAGVVTITFTTEDGAKTATLKVTVTERESSGAGQYTTHDPSGKYSDNNYTLIQATHTIISKNRIELLFTTRTGEGVLKLRFNNPLSNGRLAAGNYTCSRDQNDQDGTLYHMENYGNIGYFNSGTVIVSVNGDNYTFTASNVKTTNGITVTLSYTGILTYMNEYIDVSSVTLNQTALSLTIGGSSQLTATVNPNNAFNKNVTWSTSNSNIANVHNDGYVYANGVGTATINVTTEDGAKTATCQVTVSALPTTGNGTFSNNHSQSITNDRAVQWVNEKDTKEIDIRFTKSSSTNNNLAFTLVRPTSDTGTLKAGTYTTIRNLMTDELGIKHSAENTGSVTVTLSGENYTLTLNVTSSDGTKITGTYTGKIISTR